ncbi:MAG: Na(+)/H(+) antiporter subunit D [Deltaproteobacteria bacterium]|nr:Na(+)/H(+) antiporter subunit D [Deltaproteobacteria bacterium]
MIIKPFIHPSLVLLAGALLLPLFRGRLRQGYLLVVPLITLALVVTLRDGLHGSVPFLEGELLFGRIDTLSRLFAFIMALMCGLGTLFALHVKNDVEHIAAWFYVAGSLGVILAGDYLVLFLFWELMAFSSVFLVWARNTPAALGAGFRYLLMHGFGGILLLTGIVLHQQATGGDFSFTQMDVGALGAGGWLILSGFLLNAAAPPLHAWMPDAYGEGTPSGSVIMSAFTTKTAVYALIRGFSGLPLLLPLGVFMVLFGVVYAMLQNDARRLLAYHIISQVGYMVAGIGIGTPLAISGACAHAFVNVLYKSLLFMGTGSVLFMTGKSKFSDLGGLYAKMPRTLIYTLIGGLSISAFPLFAGFVTKGMVVSAAFDKHLLSAGFLLMMASAGTFLSTTLKLIYLTWFGESRCSQETLERAADPPRNMEAAMILTALLCIFVGCFYPVLYGRLPYPFDYHPYTAYHLSETCQFLFFTVVGFFLVLPMLSPKPSLALDCDWFYRIGGSYFLRFLEYCCSGRKGARHNHHAPPEETVTRLLDYPSDFSRKAMLLASFLTTGFMPSLAHVREDPRSWLRNASFPVGLSVFMAVTFLALMSILFFL